MEFKHKIVSLLLIVAIFSFNLVLLPAQAEEGCHCDHPHGQDGFACFCGTSSIKPTCSGNGPSLSKQHCGLEKSSSDFCIPSHEHPTMLSSTDTDLTPHISLLQKAEKTAVYGAVVLPAERPPSIL